MTLHEYREASAFVHADAGFYALIMAAMWRADTDNARKLREAFPETWAELQARYDAPAGLLANERS